MGFSKYGWKYFAPYLVLATAALVVFGLGGFVNLLIPGEGYKTGIQILITGISPLAVLWISYQTTLRAQSHVAIVLNFYITQVLVVAIIFGGIFVGLGRAFQAMVEKSLSRDQFQSQTLHTLINTLVFLHLFILPWTIFAVKRYNIKQKS
jgi:Na+/H+-dicarboxylate symporter